MYMMLINTNRFKEISFLSLFDFYNFASNVLMSVFKLSIEVSFIWVGIRNGMPIKISQATVAVLVAGPAGCQD